MSRVERIRDRRRSVTFLACLAALSLQTSASRSSALDHRATRTRRVPEEYPTIQQAINVCGAGDTVLVAPGTYFERIHYLGKSIVVRSEAGAEETVLDGEYVGTVVTFGEGSDTTTVFEGFTVTRGGRIGAELTSGVELLGASGEIVGNVFRENGTDAPDAPLIWANSAGYPSILVKLMDNTIRMNRVSPAVAYFSVSGTIIIEGNRFTRNEIVASTKRVIRAGSPASLTMRDNLFSNNPGSAVYVRRCYEVDISGNWFHGIGYRKIDLHNCFARIHGNIVCHTESGVSLIRGSAFRGQHNLFIDLISYAVSQDGSGSRLENNIITGSRIGLTHDFDSAAYSVHSDFWGNEADYDDWAHETGITFHLNPQFTAPAHHDFRLLPTSPLIDMGAELGLPGTIGPAPDIGPFEFEYTEPATAEIDLALGERRFSPGDTLNYTLTLTGALPPDDPLVRRDAWVELTGKRRHGVLAKRAAIPIRPDGLQSIEGSAAIPDDLPLGPYRVKARWGLFGSSIEASDLVDVEIVRAGRAFGREPDTER